MRKILFVFFLVLDQWSKEWALRNVEYIGKMDVGLELTKNTGIVFGLDLPVWFIYGLTFGILAWGGYWMMKNKRRWDFWSLLGLSLIFSGALGNLIDRLRYGYVVDFIKVYWWPTFNLADVWIVAGVCLFAWEVLVRKRH